MKYKITKAKTIVIILTILIIIAIIILIDNVNKTNDLIKSETNNKSEPVLYTDYDFSNLYNEPYLKYNDERYTSMFGIDVAAHQDIIDWKKVKEAGVEFAYIRIGYRGATQGKLNIDEQFENNYKGAIENNIKVGVYWYSQPKNTEEAVEEAVFVYEVLNNRHLDLPLAYDFEETEFYDGTLSRMHGMDKQTRTEVALAFIETMKEKNMDTIIYTYPYWYDNYYDWDKLSEYNVWFAQYNDYPSIENPMMIWQYSNEGRIDGITTPCDLNIMFMRNLDQN